MNFIKKLLDLFKQPDPKKPVEPWPFPVVSEDFEPRKECCGGCDKPEKQPAKKSVKKATTRKSAAKKPVTKPAKKVK